MTRSQRFVTAAILGIVSGCTQSRHSLTTAEASRAVPAVDSPDKNACGANGCGNHDGGACGSVTRPIPK
jgi:hypothetical protein